MPSQTPTLAQRQVDERLNGTLREFVSERRQRTPPLSWRYISLELRDATGIDIAGQTLRNWFPEYGPRHFAPEPTS